MTDGLQLPARVITEVFDQCGIGKDKDVSKPVLEP